MFVSPASLLLLNVTLHHASSHIVIRLVHLVSFMWKLMPHHKTELLSLSFCFIILIDLHCVDFFIKSQSILSITTTDDSPSAPAWSDPHSPQLALPLPPRLRLHEPPSCWQSRCLHPCDWDQKRTRGQGWQRISRLIIDKSEERETVLQEVLNT